MAAAGSAGTAEPSVPENAPTSTPLDDPPEAVAVVLPPLPPSEPPPDLPSPDLPSSGLPSVLPEANGSAEVVLLAVDAPEPLEGLEANGSADGL